MTQQERDELAEEIGAFARKVFGKNTAAGACIMTVAGCVSAGYEGGLASEVQQINERYFQKASEGFK